MLKIEHVRSEASKTETFGFCTGPHQACLMTKILSLTEIWLGSSELSFGLGLTLGSCVLPCRAQF